MIKEKVKTYSQLSDEELVDLSLQRDYSAFEELVKRYEGRIYRLGLKMLKSPYDAEDLLQKTFLSVFENLPKFRKDSKFSTWVFRIATNHALMKLRKESKKMVSSLNEPIHIGDEELDRQVADFECDVSQSYEIKELMEKLEKSIAELPDIYRLVFILRDVEGFSNKEVAKMLNLSVPAVKSRILRARLFLRDKLSDKGRGGKKK